MRETTGSAAAAEVEVEEWIKRCDLCTSTKGKQETTIN